MNWSQFLLSGTRCHFRLRTGFWRVEIKWANNDFSTSIRVLINKLPEKQLYKPASSVEMFFHMFGDILLLVGVSRLRSAWSRAVMTLFSTRPNGLSINSNCQLHFIRNSYPFQRCNDTQKIDSNCVIDMLHQSREPSLIVNWFGCHLPLINRFQENTSRNMNL